jgi:hypothetical protein
MITWIECDSLGKFFTTLKLELDHVQINSCLTLIPQTSSLERACCLQPSGRRPCSCKATFLRLSSSYETLQEVVSLWVC